MEAAELERKRESQRGEADERIRLRKVVSIGIWKSLQQIRE